MYPLPDFPHWSQLPFAHKVAKYSNWSERESYGIDNQNKWKPPTAAKLAEDIKSDDLRIVNWPTKPDGLLVTRLRNDERYELIIDQENEKFYVCKDCAAKPVIETCDGRLEPRNTTACLDHYIGGGVDPKYHLPMALHIKPVLGQTSTGLLPMTVSIYCATNEAFPRGQLSFIKSLRDKIRDNTGEEPLEILPGHEHSEGCIWGIQPQAKIHHGLQLFTGGPGLAKSLYFKRCRGVMKNALGEKLSIPNEQFQGIILDQYTLCLRPKSDQHHTMFGR